MSRSSMAAVIACAIAVFSAGVAGAQSGDNPNPTTPPSSTPPASNPPASVPANDQANPQATTAAATADGKLAAIAERARATSEKDKKNVEAKLDATRSEVDKEAATSGDNVLAGRLATEFGMTSDALIAEKAQYNTGWGDLMIAHSLLANAKTDVTLDQLFQMRTTDQLGWGQIAHGLDLRLGDVVSAVKSEGQVAAGRAKADGKVATIHTGHGTSTHTSSAHTHAAAGEAAAGMHGHSGK
jgi:hypothetical protein